MVNLHQHQIKELKADIIKNGGFEGCYQVTDFYQSIKFLGVRKIPNSINQGRHHLFIDLDAYRGLEFTCQLNNGLHYTFDKPSNECGCHIDIYGIGNTCKILGKNSYSQILGGFSANHTSAGHSSYYILATLEIQPEPKNEALETIERIEELLKHLKGLV